MATELADAYLGGLKAKWDEGGEGSAQDFSLTRVATEADLARLRAAYPLCPDALIDLLRRVDGTYHRDYEGKSVGIYLLGSDVQGYPYYLLSAVQILESATQPRLSETTSGTSMATNLLNGYPSEGTTSQVKAIWMTASSRTCLTASGCTSPTA